MRRCVRLARKFDARQTDVVAADVVVVAVGADVEVQLEAAVAVVTADVVARFSVFESFARSLACGGCLVALSNKPTNKMIDSLRCCLFQQIIYSRFYDFSYIFRRISTPY